MKTTVKEVEDMIDKYVVEVGLTKDQVYNAERKAWYWTRGSASIEVFITEIKFDDGFARYYIRVFSPILKVPADNQLACFRRLLELNDQSLGVKLTVLPNSDQVYATFERDIQGIDYEEVRTIIYDAEWWADHLDDQLAAEFATGRPPKA